MKLGLLYRRVVEIGIANDLRDEGEIRRLLGAEAEKMAKLEPDEREAFDEDRLFNPYADTRVLYAGEGGGDPEIRKIIVGIDMEVPEILLAHTLNRDRGAGFDLVITHHPEGRALARLFDVMRLQVDLLAAYGVTLSVAEQLMEKRIGEVERRLLPANHERVVDAARVLGLPLMCVHTPGDNCVTRWLRDRFEAEKPERLKDLLGLLRTVPEYRKAARLQAPPKIVAGADSSRCGRIYVDMTGGTEGSKDLFARQAGAGTSTVVGMHFSEDALESAKKANLNVVIAGHIASDTLGLNLLFDRLETDEPLEFVGVSGFERIRRTAG